MVVIPAAPVALIWTLLIPLGTVHVVHPWEVNGTVTEPLALTNGTIMVGVRARVRAATVGTTSGRLRMRRV